ncbi:excalibur calcium-binding domain-containing protein [Lentzea jiangxiensis]|uniref:Excalibur calcium-binding domain-containing protein n=1 Tax=Lentzea jiangxiensis TaxID=641025 RepID=A0A1H0RA14_9PSEU|nr:excalibur calcium-binding domain-containing protein [Lentzea jiangxiensis]SDP26344.1 Excalibur calcium-binding domain-containing protein [Lentzea jiangxiensis]
MTVLKEAVIVAAALLVVSACATQQPTRLAADASTTSTTTTTASPTTTTTTAPPVTVLSVVDGRTVTLSNGTNVQVAGLAQPGECWAASAVDFATKTLVGKPVQAVGSRLLLDGKDYAVVAAAEGVARAVAGADAAVAAAEAAAKQASLGFWGPSCGGLDVKPAPVAPPPVVPQPVETQPEPAPAPPPAAYYANCSAAKAAGAAPLYRGQPGYRAALDRDSDGVACE